LSFNLSRGWYVWKNVVIKNESNLEILTDLQNFSLLKEFVLSMLYVYLFFRSSCGYAAPQHLNERLDCFHMRHLEAHPL
jgi:hypothetical protein